MLEFISGEVAVDPYVDHADLEFVLKRRLAEGWTLVQKLECEPSLSSPARDMLTLIWNKLEHRKVNYVPSTQYCTFAAPMDIK